MEFKAEGILRDSLRRPRGKISAFLLKVDTETQRCVFSTVPAQCRGNSDSVGRAERKEVMEPRRHTGQAQQYRRNGRDGIAGERPSQGPARAAEHKDKWVTQRTCLCSFCWKHTKPSGKSCVCPTF